MKIVADDKIPFLEGVFEPYAEVVYLPGNQIEPSSLKNADALLTRSITFCNADLLENTQVRLIASATIGDDHIDKQYCLKNNIQWTTAAGCNATAVEQYGTTALLETAESSGFNLSGKTIGIIGVGNTGKKIQKIADLLGMKILLNDPPREREEGSEIFCSLGKIREEADIITLHVPLTFGGTDKTFHLLDEDFFAGPGLKPVILINTSRGAIVGSDVIKTAVQSGRIRKLVLDVWENEPVIDPELLGMTDIATPHIAGYSLEGKANGTAMTVNTVSRFFNLDFHNWYPKLPGEMDELKLDCRGKSFQQILHTLFLNVYPIWKDSESLKENFENFEELRRSYNFRRENTAYKLVPESCDKNTVETIKQFGFKTV